MPVPSLITSDPPVIKVSAAGGRGMSRQTLRGERWLAPFAGVRIESSSATDLAVRCRALLSVVPPGSVVSGMSAAALRGWWIAGSVASDPTLDVTSPISMDVRRQNVRCRRSQLRRGDVEFLRGIAVTSGARTLLDLARDISLIDLVVMTDAALSMRDCTIDDLAATAAFSHSRGIRRFRRMLELAEPKSESPMETLLRLVIVLSGLPR